MIVRIYFIILILLLSFTLSCYEEPLEEESKLIVDSFPYLVFMFFTFQDDQGNDKLKSIDWEVDSDLTVSVHNTNYSNPDSLLERGSNYFLKDTTRTPTVLGMGYDLRDTYYININDIIDTLKITNADLLYENIVRQNRTGESTGFYFNERLVHEFDWATLDQEFLDQLHENHLFHCCSGHEVESTFISGKNIFVINLGD